MSDTQSLVAHTPLVPTVKKQFKVTVRLPKSAPPASKITIAPQAPLAQAITPSASPQGPLVQTAPVIARSTQRQPIRRLGRMRTLLFPKKTFVVVDKNYQC